MPGTGQPYKLRLSDIINLASIIIVLVIAAGGYMVFQNKFERTEAWIEKYSYMPACVDKNTAWIEDNKDMPSDMRLSQYQMGELKDSLKELVVQVRIANKNFMQLNNGQIDKLNKRYDKE